MSWFLLGLMLVVGWFAGMFSAILIFMGSTCPAVEDTSVGETDIHA